MRGGTGLRRAWLAGGLFVAGAMLAAPAGAADAHGSSPAGGHGSSPAGGATNAPASSPTGDHGSGAAAAAPIEPLPVKPRPVPVELVRTLQLLQDRIAQGSAQAHQGQRALLALAESRMLALEPEVWTDSAALNAAVSFALGGGGPTVLRHLVASGKLPEAETPLVLGALAYLEGREKEARALLVKIDPQSVPVSLGGQLALAQSALVVRDDPTQSVRLLDLARLLAPGTLVEEGALRREIFVLAQANDLSKFETLAIQYLRRFRHSVYAGNFRQRFAAALTRLDFTGDDTRFGRLQAMLDEIEVEGRRELYLLVARAALDQGKGGTAVFAAERGVTLTEPGSVDAMRARLYRAAALVVVDGRFEESIETLRMTDRTLLEPADRDLLDAALSTARGIRANVVAPALVPAPAPAPAQAPIPAAAESTGARVLPVAPAIARAQGALGRVDEIMRRSER
ncbi:chemotaxis protein MotC [Methylobacterium sp. 37f]|uniref:chemotaxis protein MotC n=1 Tax=Methylobacterium sp. 37f TaxID=2817058 RepID=UPI001FFCCCCA|nr:chemotaxis protein MotC [Methylobacterium sp. 37f]MCK2053193.1 chemotaxis protein MotC [Methylobacterium sp. 37f]